MQIRRAAWRLAGWLVGAEWIGARAGPRASDILSLDLSRFILHWMELAVYANCYSYRYAHSIIASGDNYGLVMGHARNGYRGASISFGALFPTSSLFCDDWRPS